MPIKTKMKKSGRKRVFDQDGEGVRGELNAAAREIFNGQHREITRGPAGLRDPLLAEQGGRVQSVLQQRRRRTLASVRRQPKRAGRRS